MNLPRALDLFCGAGGASMGLHRAGFEVMGIDHRPQPRYPFTFIQADALRPPVRLKDFDLIWASPPCQAYSIANTRWGYEYPDLVSATRAMLAEHPCTVIENVATAPIRADVVLVGSMFDLDIARRRHFEVRGFQPPFALIPQTTKTTMNGGLACVAGRGANRGRWRGSWLTMPKSLRDKLSARNCKEGWAAAMGIDWMRRDEIAQAVPPAYAEFIGRAAIAAAPQRPGDAA